MRKARFTEHQIITVLKSVEAGISQASYFNWKTKYGGIEAADIKKPKDPLRINRVSPGTRRLIINDNLMASRYIAVTEAP